MYWICILAEIDEKLSKWGKLVLASTVTAGRAKDHRATEQRRKESVGGGESYEENVRGAEITVISEYETVCQFLGW